MFHKVRMFTLSSLVELDKQTRCVVFTFSCVRFIFTRFLFSKLAFRTNA